MRYKILPAALTILFGIICFSYDIAYAGTVSLTTGVNPPYGELGTAYDETADAWLILYKRTSAGVSTELGRVRWWSSEYGTPTDTRYISIAQTVMNSGDVLRARSEIGGDTNELYQNNWSSDLGGNTLPAQSIACYFEIFQSYFDGYGLYDRVTYGHINNISYSPSFKIPVKSAGSHATTSVPNFQVSDYFYYLDNDGSADAIASVYINNGGGNTYIGSFRWNAAWADYWEPPTNSIANNDRIRIYVEWWGDWGEHGYTEAYSGYMTGSNMRLDAVHWAISWGWENVGSDLWLAISNISYSSPPTSGEWEWKVPQAGDLVPSGTPNDWTWRTTVPGSGRKVPQGTADTWLWGNE